MCGVCQSVYLYMWVRVWGVSECISVDKGVQEVDISVDMSGFL